MKGKIIMKYFLTNNNIITCVVEFAIGIILLINPIAFTSGVIMIAGIILALIGLVNIIGYFRTSPKEALEKNGFAKGLIFILAGIFCIFKSEWFISTFPVLTILYGIFNLITGIIKIQWSINRIRLKQQWIFSVIDALLTLIFSVIILLNPFATTLILWNFIAITLLIEAFMDILTFALDKKSKNL